MALVRNYGNAGQGYGSQFDPTPVEFDPGAQPGNDFPYEVYNPPTGGGGVPVPTPGGGGGGGGGGGINLGPITGKPSFSFPTVPDFNPPDFQVPTWQDVQANDPGYQFRLKGGTDALERSAAARGTLRTGGTLKDIVDYGQNYSTNEYANAFNRAKDAYQLRYQGSKDKFAPKLAQWQTQAQAEMAAALAQYQQQFSLYALNHQGGGGGSNIPPPPNPPDVSSYAKNKGELFPEYF